MAGIFKAYDIRGVYGEALDEDMAYRIGRAYATFLKAKRVVVGRDMRPHSKPLFKALADGLTAQGADVIDIGLASTPLLYFADGRLAADGGIIITASHNPGEWNGFKLCREQAIPISGDTGIKDIEQIVANNAFAEADRTGSISSKDMMPEYIEHISSFADIRRPLRVCIDYANGMGIIEGEVLKGKFDIDPLFDTLDGSFPNHEANPLKLETLDAIRERMKSSSYDFGVAFDGDADRAGFLDETGEFIAMDMITALIAKEILRHKTGATIYYDLRSSWAVREIIEENGGIPRMSRVGHAFIKQQMREADAVFAGELSGHYYFKENYYAESSSLAVLMIANMVSASDKPLSGLIRPLRRYHASGEINSTVVDADATLEKIKDSFAEGRLIELDGVTVEFDDWWFNVRASNTEPLVRLNLEAKTEALMRTKRDEVLAMIRS